MRPASAPAELLDGRPFLLSTALAMGVSATQLQGPLFRRVCREVYVAVGAPDDALLRLAAVALILPEGAVLSGRAAAWLHGLDISPTRDEPLEVTAPRGVTLLGRGLFVPRQALLTSDDVLQVGGLLVTSPLRTAYDLARRPPLVEGVVALDAFLHAGLISVDDLTAYAADHPRLRGVRQIERVSALADAGADSPMESRLRMALVLEAGLPPPVTAYAVRDRHGKLIARLDTAYPERWFGVEFDGRVHLTNAARVADLRRHNELQAHGWPVLRYSGDDFYLRRPRMLREVTAQYAAGGRHVADLGEPGLTNAKSDLNVQDRRGGGGGGAGGRDGGLRSGTG